MKLLFQVFQSPEPLSSQLQPPLAGRGELPQGVAQAPLHPTPQNTQSTSQATSPTPGVPAAAAAAALIQVSHTLLLLTTHIFMSLCEMY